MIIAIGLNLCERIRPMPQTVHIIVIIICLVRVRIRHAREIAIGIVGKEREAILRVGDLLQTIQAVVLIGRLVT